MPLFYSQIGLTNQDYLKRKKEKELSAQERKNKRATDKSLQNLHPKTFSNVGSSSHMHALPGSFNGEKYSAHDKYSSDKFNNTGMHYTGGDKYQDKYNQEKFQEKYKFKSPSANRNNNYAYNHGYDREYNRGNIQNSYKISEEDDRLSRVSK
jgi:hypothetical protein